MTTLAAAFLAAAACNTPVSWVENAGYPYSIGPFYAVCADENGIPVAESCEAYATLHWHMAQAAGLEPDSRYENAFSACTNGER